MKRYYKYIIATTVASVSTLGSAYLIGTIKNENNLLASWTTNYEPSVKWNSNWDHRDPSSLAHPKSRHMSTRANESQILKENGNEKKTQDDFELNKHSARIFILIEF